MNIFKSAPKPAKDEVDVGRLILEFLKEKDDFVSPEEVHEFITNHHGIEMSFYELGIISADLAERRLCDLLSKTVDEVPIYALRIQDIGLVYLKFKF